MNIFAKTERPHLRIASVQEGMDANQSIAVYPYDDLQAMAEIRAILEPFDQDARIRVLKYVTEVLDIVRPDQ